MRGIANLVEARGGGLWVKQDQPRYERIAHWPAPLLRDDAEAQDGPLASFLQDKQWVINLDEYRATHPHYGSLVVPDWMSGDDETWLVIPLMLHDDLFGFIVLLTARTKITIDWEVNDLLKTAGRQVASPVKWTRSGRPSIQSARSASGTAISLSSPARAADQCSHSRQVASTSSST